VNPLLPYNWFWLVAGVIPFFILGAGIWYELHKMRKNNERDYIPSSYPTPKEVDDLLDERLR
jgi:hypothetical protein